jgi:hypothetical protein
MKFFITILVPLIGCLPVIAQSAANNAKTDTAKQKYILEYDPGVLWVKGNSLPIGIISISDKGQKSQTKGFLNGADNWSKYKIDVDSGSYSDGHIKIKGSGDEYKKGDSLTINVYAKKWFLGGRGKLLFRQKIPYDYETKISVLTTGNFSKAPGDHVQFGVRTYFDNKMFTDKWVPVKKNLKDFVFKFDGVHISKSKDDLEIDKDPTKINNDKIKLIASLVKNPVIKDTLNVLLDYIANYQCSIPSYGAGHELNVTAAIYHDSIINAQLLKIQVIDNATHKTYNYWVNTNGGSITILSKGADGSDGSNGIDGFSGMPGSPGVVSVNTETTTNADGTTTTTTNTVTGAGGNGSNGQDGGNGQDGNAGGNGGNIVVNYSPAVSPFLSLIKSISTAGKGGSGGRAGRGGMGGSAGIGNPNGNPGSNGLDGHNGFDGSDGRKGTVIFTMVGSVQ